MRIRIRTCPRLVRRQLSVRRPETLERFRSDPDRMMERKVDERSVFAAAVGRVDRDSFRTAHGRIPIDLERRVIRDHTVDSNSFRPRRYHDVTVDRMRWRRHIRSERVSRVVLDPNGTVGLRTIHRRAAPASAVLAASSRSSSGTTKTLPPYSCPLFPIPARCTLHRRTRAVCDCRMTSCRQSDGSPAATLTESAGLHPFRDAGTRSSSLQRVPASHSRCKPAVVPRLSVALRTGPSSDVRPSVDALQCLVHGPRGNP